MNTKFTPGPWRAGAMETVRTDEGNWVCDLSNNDYKENRQADINLIAAAPLLYEACKELIAAVPIQNHACCGHKDYNCAVMVNALTQAEAAIAAAEQE